MSQPPQDQEPDQPSEPGEGAPEDPWASPSGSGEQDRSEHPAYPPPGQEPYGRPPYGQDPYGQPQ
ncbi:MAG: hypothetical protein QOF53_3538, partial [Nocardioidaceae bacterium]|nr:hypothetical protein [Nocardioidaceae bacterium]